VGSYPAFYYSDLEKRKRVQIMDSCNVCGGDCLEHVDKNGLWYCRSFEDSNCVAYRVIGIILNTGRNISEYDADRMAMRLLTRFIIAGHWDKDFHAYLIYVGRNQLLESELDRLYAIVENAIVVFGDK
tara:strand:+ start:838 stop:1221 length:384 start_codon:yes stop_codon:yes gene_type:complete